MGGGEEGKSKRGGSPKIEAFFVNITVHRYK